MSLYASVSRQDAKNAGLKMVLLKFTWRLGSINLYFGLKLL